ncbi:MAG: DUF2784 domain-containing protein [Planctomycetes bacterium]|nr:DUF2784 domain-containing protein [Planctomycetota bacterium]
MNEFLANVIVAIHLGYLLFVIGGMLAIVLGMVLRWQWIRNPWFRFTHMAMILIVAFEAVIGFECPLTTWEHAFRGESFDSQTFVGKCLQWLMFPEIPEQYLNMIYYLFAAAVVASFIIAPPRFRRKSLAGSRTTDCTDNTDSRNIA